MTEIKPTSFAQGVPKSEDNGFFGLEPTLTASKEDVQTIVAVVVYSVEVLHRRHADTLTPVVSIKSIEPLLNDEQHDAAMSLLVEARDVRSGQEALDLPDVDA